MSKRILVGLRMALTVAAFCAGLFAAELVTTAQPTSADIAGSWLGTLDVGGLKLRLVFRIGSTPEGGLTAVLVSVDQGGQEIIADEVTFEDRNLTLKVNRIGGVFAGVLQEDNRSFDGTWKQGGLALPLLMRRTLGEPIASRPQNPKEPYPYVSEKISYRSGNNGDIEIAGTLTIPKDSGPHPAAILISGSGPQDRDETVFGHRPFLVLSDYLTRHGIAVLRTDDRGVGASTGTFETATTEDFASDVEAGLAFLETRPEIDAKRIGLLGHSEGGLVAPIVATGGKEVAFLVLMAAPGLPGEEILYLQGERLARAQGMDDNAVASYRRLQENVFQAVKVEKDKDALEGKVRAAITDWLKSAGEQAKRLVGDPEVAIRAQTSLVGSPWFRYFLTHDPRPVLERVRCPVLAINGEKDLQVPAQANLGAIRAALLKGGNDHIQVRALPELNHLFQHARIGVPGEYGSIEETMSPEVLALVADWINGL